MNKYPLLSKLLLIGLLMALLAIPLALVRQVIAERSAYRQQAAAEVARAHAGPQTLTGPVLWLPYTETFVRKVKVEGKAGATREELVSEERVSVQFPKTLDTRSRLATETRWRGIFPVTVYTSQHANTGRFVWEEVMPRQPGGRITLGQPLLLMGVSDTRGLLAAPQMRLAGSALAVEQAPASSPLPLAARVDPGLLKPGAELEVALDFELAGTGGIGWVPLADDSSVTLTSSWPHPSFGGDFLPRTRSVTASGFEATWRVSSLSSRAQSQFLEDPRGDSPPSHTVEQFSVSLNDPVDVYRLTERATKYAGMFIVLTFAAFFVLEMVRRWRIHPMQYLMIGAALVLFFLLLLSLAEHMDFVLAYGLASTGCIALLGHYLRHVLGGWGAGLGMSGLLVALYGVLYGILVSEDNALMMGSLLLFGVLAAIMVATRRLDWYSVMRPEPVPASPGVEPHSA
ncbi:cell envelope integrity protein CreD [uncultured Aquincola sp.]|uniref:cell envelope integrity protein CreD n=1 Tax=uncultured Aquincola sp. TaxID=886556 RepID=UPI0032B12915